jgi:VWFA-related protein
MPDTRWHSARIWGSLLGLLPAAFMSTLLFSQDKDPSPKSPTDNRATYKVQANVIVVKVSVADKNGNPIGDLNANDFKVYDDNRPQEIQTFALELVGPEESVEKKADGTVSKSSAIQKKNAGMPRLISIVIDDLTMESVQDFPRIVDAAKEFVKNNLAPGDQVSILSGSRKVQYPFSDNRQKLMEELNSVPKQLNVELPFHFCPVITDLEAWNIAAMNRNSIYYCQLVFKCSNPDDNPPDPCTLIAHMNKDNSNNTLSKEEEMLNQFATQTNADGEFRTRNLLYTIQQHIRTLRHFDGNKSLIIFSDGFLAERRTKADYQMQDLVNTALRSDIVLNTVSTRGINNYDEAEIADSQQRWMISMREDDKQAQHASLAHLAEETGGLFFQNNSLIQPLQKIIQRQATYYILTYGMPPHKPNGSYHSIKIEIGRPGVKFNYRKGYYTAKEETTYENTKREDIMDALNAPGNMNEIPMTLSYNYYREDDATYVASFVSNVNIRGLQFPKEDDRLKNQISFVLAAYDEHEKFINGIEKVIDFQLLEDSYAGLKSRGISSKVELKLPPGQYKIKAVVREGNQGKMGSIAKTIEIP